MVHARSVHLPTLQDEAQRVRPRRTPSSNTLFSLRAFRWPGAISDDDNGLWTERAKCVEGDPIIMSTWELDDSEREAIAQGCNIQLAIWGTGHPPVMMRVTAEPLEELP